MTTRGCSWIPLATRRLIPSWRSPHRTPRFRGAPRSILPSASRDLDRAVVCPGLRHARVHQLVRGVDVCHGNYHRTNSSLCFAALPVAGRVAHSRRLAEQAAHQRQAPADCLAQLVHPPLRVRFVTAAELVTLLVEALPQAGGLASSPSSPAHGVRIEDYHGLRTNLVGTLTRTATQRSRGELAVE